MTSKLLCTIDINIDINFVNINFGNPIKYILGTSLYYYLLLHIDYLILCFYIVIMSFLNFTNIIMTQLYIVVYRYSIFHT